MTRSPRPSSSPAASIPSETSRQGMLSQCRALITASMAPLCRSTVPCEQKWKISFFLLRHTPIAAGCGAARRRSAARGRSVSQKRRAASVTGRLVPDSIAALLPATQAVTFIPSCYVGPYVAYLCHGSSLIVFYNCRSTAASAVPLPTVRNAAIYPPLKALADETRLQILALLHDRELYAQEIVERLNISQPAVSRHLNLMVAAGVLTIRREGNAKYYAINRDVLAELARAFSSFV